MEAGGITVVSSSDYDVAASCLILEYRFSRGAEESRATTLYYVYTSAQ